MLFNEECKDPILAFIFSGDMISFVNKTCFAVYQSAIFFLTSFEKRSLSSFFTIFFTTYSCIKSAISFVSSENVFSASFGIVTLLPNVFLNVAK